MLFSNAGVSGCAGMRSFPKMTSTVRVSPRSVTGLPPESFSSNCTPFLRPAYTGSSAHPTVISYPPAFRCVCANTEGGSSRSGAPAIRHPMAINTTRAIPHPLRENCDVAPSLTSSVHIRSFHRHPEVNHLRGGPRRGSLAFSASPEEPIQQGKERNRVHHLPHHPHRRSPQPEIVERGEPPEARHNRVIHVQGVVGERQVKSQHEVHDVGHADHHQAHPHRRTGQSRRRGGDDPPEQQAARHKTRVLQRVNRRTSQGRVVRSGKMPKEENPVVEDGDGGRGYELAVKPPQGGPLVDPADEGGRHAQD